MKLLCLLLLTLSLRAEVVSPAALPIYQSEKTYHFKNDNKGKKTVINFWASWCTACLKELDELEQLKKEHPGFNYIAVNAGEKPKKIKKFMKKHGFSYTILLDKDKKFSKSLKVLELPRTMVIDENLKVLYNDKIPPKKLP